MMGLGPCGNGSASSSSSLSALAPPFTVDRFLEKPNSNPLVHLSEAHFVGPFNPPVNRWSYSQQNSAPILDFLGNPVSESDSSHLPYSDPLRPSVSRTVQSPSTLSPLNRAPQPATDPFRREKCSDSLITSAAETDTYYSHYAPPAVSDNNPLVSMNDSDYKLLRTSSVASLNGSYQDGYTHSLSGLEYPRPWNGVWNGLEEALGCKHAELEQMFIHKGKNIANSSINKKRAKPGASATEGLVGCGETRTIVDRKCINTQGRTNFKESFKREQFVDECLGGYAKFDTLKPSGPSLLGSTFTFPQSHPAAVPMESITSSFNHENPFNTLPQKASPAVTIRQPTSCIMSSAVKSCLPKHLADTVSLNSTQKVPHLLPNCEGKEIFLDASPFGVEMDRNVPMVFKSRATDKREMLNNSLDAASKTRSEKRELLNNSVVMNDGAFRINGSGNSQSEVCPGIADSVENSCENPDYHYPAVDSPCWKGAPSSRGFAFEGSDDSPRIMKKLDTLNDAVKIYGQKSGRADQFLESGSSPSPKGSFTVDASSRVQGFDGVAKDGFDEVSGDGVSVKLAKLHERESIPKMNAHVLIDAILNLSELLLFHYSNVACALKEHDSEALKLVIRILDACLQKNVEPASPKQESLTKQGVSEFVQDLPDLGKGVTMGRPLVMKEKDSGVKERLIHEVMKLCTLSCEKDDCYHAKVVADTRRDDATTKVIKEILHENLQNEEGKEPEIQLYKNLWLEAEAALCCVNYKARFDRLRGEMEGVMSQKVRGGENLSCSSLVQNKPKMAENPASKAQGAPIERAVGHVDDVETSVIERFRILKCRGESLDTSSDPQLLSKLIGHGFSDDWMSESGRVQVLGKQSLPAGRDDGLPSGWEHVRKDEVQGHN